jgi:hypothetical protein
VPAAAAPVTPTARPQTASPGGLAEHQPAYLARSRAERKPNPELLLPQRNRVRHGAVRPDAREQESGDRERPAEQHDETMCRPRLVDVRGERPHREHRHRRRDTTYRVADGGCERRRIVLVGLHEVHEGMPRRLRQREVNLLVQRTRGFPVPQVTNDTDDGDPYGR